MSTSNSDVIIKNLTENAIRSTEGALEFSRQELPDLVQEMLFWNATWSFVWWLVGCIFLAMAVLLIIGISKKSEKKEKVEDEECGAVVGCLIIGAIFFLANLTWLQIILAPKMYLLDYLS